MELVEETKDCTIPTPHQPYKGITLPETNTWNTYLGSTLHRLAATTPMIYL